MIVDYPYRTINFGRDLCRETLQPPRTRFLFFHAEFQIAWSGPVVPLRTFLSFQWCFWSQICTWCTPSPPRGSFNERSVRTCSRSRGKWGRSDNV